MNPCSYDHLNYDTGAKNVQQGKDSQFNKWYWENWTAMCKRMKLYHFLIPHTKINSKWNRDLNVKLETVNLLGENMGSKLFYIGLSSISLDMSSQASETKAKTNKWDYIKLKRFCTQRKP